MRTTTAHPNTADRLIVAVVLALLTALGVALAAAAAQAPTALLQVAQNGPGTVTVNGVSPDAASCGNHSLYPDTNKPCTYANFLQGDTVTLTAKALPTEPDAVFQGWSDDRCPAAPVCTLTLADQQSVVALFSPLAVDVSVDGGFTDGTETVTITDASAKTCTAVPVVIDKPCRFELGAALTLVADGPAPTWNAEDCDAIVAAATDRSTCTMTLLARQQVHVAFRAITPGADAPPRTNVIFRVRKTGSGSGTIRGALDCGSTCSVTKPFRDPVTVVADAAQGSRFVRWTGACGTKPTCALQATATSVTAEFAALPAAPQDGAPSTPFRASVGRISATGHGRKRSIKVPVAVNASADVVARLARRGRRVATKGVAVTPGAVRVVRVRVPRRSRRGTYRLTVTIRDRAGSSPVRVTRNVRVPR
jgi:hypothetical protein